MNIRKYFTLGRWFDWKVFSNKFIILYFFASFAFYVLYSLLFVTQDPANFETYTIALSSALLVFLAWTYAREFHPGDHFTSILTAIAVSISIVWFPAGWNVSLLLLLILLLSVRVLNHTAGNKRVLGDFVLLSLVSIWGGYSAQSWVFTVIPAIAFLIDGVIDADSNYPTIFGAILTAVTMYFVYTFGVVRHIIYLAPLLEYFFLFFGFLTVVSVLFRRGIGNIYDDRGQDKLTVLRVLASKVFFVGTTIIILLYTGEFGYIAALPGMIIFTIYPVLEYFNE